MKLNMDSLSNSKEKQEGTDMKQLWRRTLAVVCVAALMAGMLLTGMGALAAAGEHTLWIVGDSTGCDYAADQDSSYFYKRCGFGTALKEYVDSTYTVTNLAVSGRSSKSFPDESKENYDALTAGLKAGDVLLIAFGHNDEKTDAAHYTAPGGTSTTEGSFAKSLTDLYIKVAQAKGATPILCTPIVRRTETAGNWGGDKLHTANGGDYAQDIRNLGAELSVPVVDMTTLTKEKYDAVGVAESANFHAWLANKSVDNTHLNAYGAQVVAQIMAGEIAKINGLDLAGHIDSAKVSATLDKATLLVQNPSWVDPATIPYAPPTTKSTQCEPYTTPDGKITFYGTAMGDLGGDASKANHVRETTADGNMRIAVLNSKGKISGTADGIVMYYCQVPAGKAFTLTAKAHVNNINTQASNPGQGGFGLMARDDMYIDEGKETKATLASDYVTAGCLGDGNGVNFARKGGSLNKNSGLSLANPLAVGQDYALSIVRSVDGNYACSIDGVSKTYDYSIDTIDGAYTYIGMFCARNMDVTYSDITVEVDGGVVVPPSVTPSDAPSTPPTPDQPAIPGAVAGGGLEALFAELPGVADADVTAVKYSGAMTGELAGDDLTYLVRDASLADGKTGIRVDIPGLKAGKYDLTITAKGKDYVAKDIEVLAHDRSGFAHRTVAEDMSCTPYTEGVGAYKDDGTLKENATVLYVTEANKETVTLTVKNSAGQDITVTGIGNILNTKGYDQNLKKAGGNANTSGKILAKMADAHRPIVVRIVGEVTKPQGVTDFNSTGNGGSKGDNGGMCIMEYVGNITIEGVGADATVNGWGFSFSADGTGRTAEKNNKRDGQGENIEVRNLTFRNVPEDCIGINGAQKKDQAGVVDFQDSAEHVWVHNNAFYGPKNLPDASDEGDKSEGDGAVDFRNGECMTLSYNYFEGYHKTSLIGSGDDNLQYHVTWHHNWWKNVQSRSPLARQADIHIYNNLYDGQTSYCMSLRANSYVYSEFNSFVNNAKDPVKLESSSGSTIPVGACKSYQDDFSGVKAGSVNQATVVTDKTQQVASTNKFANFDTATGCYITTGDYKLDTLADAKTNIETWGGVEKTADRMTTVALKAVGGDTPSPSPSPVPSAEPSESPSASPSESPSTRPGGRPSYSVSTTQPSAAPSEKPEDGKATPVTETYQDVEADTWYTTGVQFVVDQKLFIGVSDHSFAPELAMSRAMVMTVLARVDGKETTPEAGQSWYHKAMDWAVSAGISDGTEPEANVTLEQFATMLYRYAVDQKLTQAVKADLKDVPDAGEVSDWAAEAITWAVDQGILQGDQAGYLKPQANATRAQAAVILERFVEKCVK